MNWWRVKLLVDIPRYKIQLQKFTYQRLYLKLEEIQGWVNIDKALNMYLTAHLKKMEKKIHLVEQKHLA